MAAQPVNRQVDWFRQHIKTVTHALFKQARFLSHGGLPFQLCTNAYCMSHG